MLIDSNYFFYLFHNPISCSPQHKTDWCAPAAVRGPPVRSAVPKCGFTTCRFHHLVPGRNSAGQEQRDGKWSHPCFPSRKLFDFWWWLIGTRLFYHFWNLQTSADGNQTTSTLSISLNRTDAGKYLSCKAYNTYVPSDALEDGWQLDIQCKYNGVFMISRKNWHNNPWVIFAATDNFVKIPKRCAVSTKKMDKNKPVNCWICLQLQKTKKNNYKLCSLSPLPAAHYKLRVQPSQSVLRPNYAALKSDWTSNRDQIELTTTPRVVHGERSRLHCTVKFYWNEFPVTGDDVFLDSRCW